MSLTFGFYNSLNGDRKYDATHFSQIFDGVINDGVFMSVGEALMVSATTEMAVKVGIGRAWFNGTWTRNDAPMILNLDPAEVLLNRIDAIVLDVNATERTNSIKILKGVPASEPARPELANEDNLHQYPLAYILVSKGVTEITQANITNMVGTSTCPFVTGILETMDIDALIAQWNAQFTEWNSVKRAEFDSFMIDVINEVDFWREKLTTDAAELLENQQNQFDTWFEHIRDQLSEDAAGNLQNQIDGVKGFTTEIIMSASKWNSNKYSFEDLYPSNKYDVEIELSDSCTVNELNEWLDATIIGNANTNICTAFGVAPAIDIPIIIKVVTK